MMMLMILIIDTVLPLVLILSLGLDVFRYMDIKSK